MINISRFLVIVTVLSASLFAFTQREIERRFSGTFLTGSMLQPGETVDDMVITTGAEDAYPLWSLCSSTKENDHSIRVDCRELALCANVAIGHTFGVMDLIPPSMDWEELSWEMSVDGHPIDLQAFGVHDLAHPYLAPSPSPVREVFNVARLWNVVLANPTPGVHRLQGQAQSRDGAEAYTWVVNFTVATP
jgi:hypothetical protein